jgi:hypothetical protein
MKLFFELNAYFNHDKHSKTTHTAHKHNCSFLYFIKYSSGLPRAGLSPGENFFQAPTKGGLTKNLYTKSERLHLSCQG